MGRGGGGVADQVDEALDLGVGRVVILVDAPHHRPVEADPQPPDTLPAPPPGQPQPPHQPRGAARVGASGTSHGLARRAGPRSAEGHLIGREGGVGGVAGQRLE